MSLSEIWAKAVIDYGLSPDQAGKLTIKKILYLADRHNKQQELIDTRLARLCFVISRSAGNDKVRIEDFLPQKPQTEEEMVDFLTALTVAMGGEVICN